MDNQTSHLNQSSYFDNWYERQIPHTFILLAYLLLGVLGNATVLYIYLKRYRSYSDGRFFIPVLAVLDMIACVVNCLAHLLVASSLLNGALSGLGCKFSNFLCSTTTNVSIYTILIIAFDRYLKICRPTGRQMTQRWKKIAVVITIIVAVLFSIPYFKLVDMAILKLKDGLTVKLCVGRGTRATKISYGLARLLVIFTELIIMSVLYFRIYIVVFRRPMVTVLATKITSPATEKTSNAKPGSDDSDMTVSTDNQKVNEDHVNVRAQEPRRDFQTSFRKVPSSRITVIFLVITIAFAICYIPKFVFMFLAILEVEIWGEDPDLLTLRLILRSFYICNNIINPFIYGCLDKKFQLEIKKMFCSYCNR